MWMPAIVLVIWWARPPRPLANPHPKQHASTWRHSEISMPCSIPPGMPKSGISGQIDCYEMAVRQFAQQILPTVMPKTTVWGDGSINHGWAPPPSEVRGIPFTVTPSRLLSTRCGSAPAFLVSVASRVATAITTESLTKTIARNELPSDWQSRQFVFRRGLATIGCSLLVGLTGCGPAPSDNTPSLASNTSVDGRSLSKQGLSPRNDVLTPAVSVVPLATANGTSSVSGIGTFPRGDSPYGSPVVSSQPGHPVEGLVVPESMAQKLTSPSVLVRLRALEAWAREAPPGAIDPFILAFEDKDERVRARAQKLIEQDWARRAEAEKSGERDERSRGKGISE
jgi:hypothetical protein